LQRIASRIFDALFSVWALLTLVFFVTRMLGDPTVLLLPLGASPEEAEALRIHLGLNHSLGLQYWNLLRTAVHGDFGQSFLFARPALQVVLERLPATLELAALALALGTVLGVSTGFLLALHPRGWLHRVLSGVVLVGQATPVFWLSLVLILVASVWLHLLPSSGIGGWKHVLLPALSLGCFFTAQIARISESRVREELVRQHVRMGWAKGLPAHVVYLRYVLWNAAAPIVTMIGLLAGEMAGGSVIVETIFAWPGVGRVIYQAIENQDYPVVSAGIVVVSVLVIAINLCADLVCLWLDPRTRRTA